MLSINKKSHVIFFIITLSFFGILKEIALWQNCEEVLNSLNSTSCVEIV